MKVFIERFLDLPPWFHGVWVTTLCLLSYSAAEARKEIEHTNGFFEILIATFLSTGNSLISLAAAYLCYRLITSALKIEWLGIVSAVIIFGATRIGIEVVASKIPGVDWRYYEQCSSSPYC